MNLYNKYVLPKIVHFACSRSPHMRQRQKIIPLATGNVLEIGIGSGLNLSLYDSNKVKHLWGLEPSLEMWNFAQNKADKLPFDFDFLQASAEEIPLDTNSVDTIIMTYTLCTIPDPQAALKEMRRVLRPAGKLLFCEHGESPDKSVAKWQNRLNPIWIKFSGGCNLNRNIAALLQEAGFTVADLNTNYQPGWRPVSYNYCGQAE